MTGDAAAAIHWWPIRSRALNDTAGIVLCVYVWAETTGYRV